MRFAALLPFALCLAPFASAQSESGDLREEIRKIVREEIRAAMKDAMKEMHGAPSAQGKVIEVEGKPLAAKKVVEVKKAQPMVLQWDAAKPNGAGAKANIVMGKPKITAMRLADGKPIEIDHTAIAELVEGQLGKLGKADFRILSGDAESKPGSMFFVHPSAGNHEVKVVKGHALQTKAPAECEAECKVECEVVSTTECKTECCDTPKAAKSECCEAAKAAAECCEAAKAVSECCEEAKAAAECCEGQKCEECVVEVVAPKAAKLEKAAKKQKKEGGKKKGKKTKPAETTETFELKIG